LIRGYLRGGKDRKRGGSDKQDLSPDKKKLVETWLFMKI